MKKILTAILLLSLFVCLYSSVEEASWTRTEYTENGQTFVTYSASASVATADSVFYTEPTDFRINWNVPLKVVINPTAATIDDATLPVTMYIGTASTFDLSITGAGVATITGGYEYGTIEADVKASTGQVTFYTGTRVLADSTDSYYWITPCSQLAFDLDTTDGFTASTVTIEITQPLDVNIPNNWYHGKD